MDDFEARRKLNELKTKAGQETKQNSPIPIKVYPSLFLAFACSFFGGIGLSMCLGYVFAGIAKILTGKSLTLFYNFYHNKQTLLGIVALLLIVGSGAIFSGYICACLCAKFRFILSVVICLIYLSLLVYFFGIVWFLPLPLCGGVFGWLLGK